MYLEVITCLETIRGSLMYSRAVDSVMLSAVVQTLSLPTPKMPLYMIISLILIFCPFHCRAPTSPWLRSIACGVHLTRTRIRYICTRKRILTCVCIHIFFLFPYFDCELWWGAYPKPSLCEFPHLEGLRCTERWVVHQERILELRI